MKLLGVRQVGRLALVACRIIYLTSWWLEPKWWYVFHGKALTDEPVAIGRVGPGVPLSQSRMIYQDGKNPLELVICSG